MRLGGAELVLGSHALANELRLLGLPRRALFTTYTEHMHASFEAAQEKMTALKEMRYTPNPAAKRVYDELYGVYRELHDSFGGVPGAKADLPSLMKRLLALRERETAG